MSLDIWFEDSELTEEECICECCGNAHTRRYNAHIENFNITHNLAKMAVACGVYECLWRAPENGFTKASQLIEPIEKAISMLEKSPAHFTQYDPINGWGDYYGFLKRLRNIRDICVENPQANFITCR